MQIIETIEGVRKALHAGRADGKTVGFVPTMGALHAGHLALVARARAECDVVVVSIFVNPLQFGANEDLTRYPRPFDEDCRLASEGGVDVLFAPSALEMYPNGPVLTTVCVDELRGLLEGAHRPGHFDGVATVVSKLLNIVGECHSYFGEKDWQQLAVVRQLVRDLDFPVEVVGCPIVRESDGLALSSRNVYLSAEERIAALALSRSLKAGLNAVANGVRDPARVSDVMRAVFFAEPLVEVQYATVVGTDFRQPDVITDDSRLLVAAQVGSCRLIDNAGVASSPQLNND